MFAPVHNSGQVCSLIIFDRVREPHRKDRNNDLSLRRNFKGMKIGKACITYNNLKRMFIFRTALRPNQEIWSFLHLVRSALIFWSREGKLSSKVRVGSAGMLTPRYFRLSEAHGIGKASRSWLWQTLSNEILRAANLRQLILKLDRPLNYEISENKLGRETSGRGRKRSGHPRMQLLYGVRFPP